MYNVREMYELFKELHQKGLDEVPVTIAYLRTTHHLSNIDDHVFGAAKPFMEKDRKPVVVLCQGEKVYNDDEDFVEAKELFL